MRWKVKSTKKQLEPGKLMAKRVSPHPLAPIVTLSRTAQAPSPPLRPQPPVAASAAAPAPLPLPLPNPGTLALPPAPSPQSPSPSPCRLGTDSPPCVSAWYVPRYGLRPRSPLPGPPKSQGASFKCCRSSFCLARGLWVAVSRGQAQGVAPLINIPTFTHTPLLGVQASFQVVLCSWGSVMRGPRGKEQQRSPGLLLAYALCIGGSDLVPVPSELSPFGPRAPLG